MKVLEILHENEEFNPHQRAAWIRPNGTVYNLGETGHSDISDDIDYSPQEQELIQKAFDGEINMDPDEAMFCPMYNQGYVRVIMGFGEIGLCGTAEGVAAAWMSVIRKHVNNFNRVYADIYQGYKHDRAKSKVFNLPADRIPLIRYMTEEL